MISKIANDLAKQAESKIEQIVAELNTPLASKLLKPIGKLFTAENMTILQITDIQKLQSTAISRELAKDLKRASNMVLSLSHLISAPQMGLYAPATCTVVWQGIAFLVSGVDDRIEGAPSVYGVDSMSAFQNDCPEATSAIAAACQVRFHMK